MRRNEVQIGDCGCEIQGVRLTVFPDFRKLYNRIRTESVQDETKRRLLELRLGEEVKVLGSVAARYLAGEGDL